MLEPVDDSTLVGRRVSFWYLKRNDSGEKIFHIVDIQKKTNRPAYDVETLARQLSNLTKSRVNPSPNPVSQIEFSDADTDTLLLQHKRQWYRYQPLSNELKPVEHQSKLDLEQKLFLPPRSGSRGSSTHITLVNDTKTPVEIVWISGRQQVSYGQIEPGNSIKQQTYIGHVWGLKTKGKLKGCFAARADDQLNINESLLKNVVIGKKTQPQNRSTYRPRTNGYTNRSSSSPDRKWNLTVRDYNLWLVPRRSNATDPPQKRDEQLSTDGTESHTFQRIGSGTRWLNPSDAQANRGDVRWSPDSQYAAAFQTKNAPEPRVHYIESTPQDQLQPKLQSYSYPKPGDELLTQRVRVFSVADRSEIPVSNSLFDNPFSLRFIGWTQTGNQFRLLYNERGHQVIRLLNVDATTGKVRTLIEETSPTFIHYSSPGKSVFDDLPNDQILWASERSGWNHLYRFDGKTGNLINAVTSGEWNVKRIHHIDKSTQEIWFYAVGVVADQDPYHEHFCRVKFDGSEFRVLTQGDGTHQINFESGHRFFVDTYSRVDMPPVNELRLSKTGELIVELDRATTGSNSSDRKLPTRFVAKGRDKETDIWGIIHWPRNFDPTRKYPVVENIYAGPHDHHVPKRFRRRFGHQHSIADAGMIVVQIDGMGTAWRSKAFHDVCFKNLKDSGFPDRIAWIKAAAKQHPQMDIERVGIYGGSAGGQSAMAALLWHNQFYQVAVADCGCHDNRMDKIWWNEQWMGWPVDASYADNSNKENAHLLNGHLMLTLGELDRNVDPASTTQVVKELIRHSKDFDFLLIAGRGHGAGESPWAAKRRLNFLKRHLQVDE